MKKTILILSISICYFSAKSQILNRVFINNWIKERDSSFKSDDPILYVINNSSYDTIQVDHVLKNWSFDDLLHIYYLKPATVFYHPSPATIIIYGKRQLNKNSIKSSLEKAKKIFKDNSLPAKPDLYLNDVLIDSFKVASILNSIKWKHIYCIDTGELMNAPQLYAQYVKNGSVRIWLKKEAD